DISAVTLMRRKRVGKLAWRESGPKRAERASVQSWCAAPQAGWRRRAREQLQWLLRAAIFPLNASIRVVVSSRETCNFGITSGIEQPRATMPEKADLLKPELTAQRGSPHGMFSTHPEAYHG